MTTGAQLMLLAGGLVETTKLAGMVSSKTSLRFGVRPALVMAAAASS